MGAATAARTPGGRGFCTPSPALGPSPDLMNLPSLEKRNYSVRAKGSVSRYKLEKVVSEGGEGEHLRWRDGALPDAGPAVVRFPVRRVTFLVDGGFAPISCVRPGPEHNHSPMP